MMRVIGPPFKIHRSYVYQFPFESGKERQEKVVFEDIEIGKVLVGNDSFEIVAPTRFNNRINNGFIAIEHIILGNLSNNPEMSITWINSKREIKRRMEFKAGEDILSTIPMNMADENSPSIATAYRVRHVDYDYDEDEVYGLVEFENLIPVLSDSGEVFYELFSLSCYEIHATMMQMGVMGSFI